MFVIGSPLMDILFLVLLGFFLHGLYAIIFYPVYKKGKRNLINPFLTLTVLQVLTMLGSAVYILFFENTMDAMLHLTVLFLGMLAIQVIQQTQYLKRFEKG